MSKISDFNLSELILFFSISFILSFSLFSLIREIIWKILLFIIFFPSLFFIINSSSSFSIMIIPEPFFPLLAVLPKACSSTLWLSGRKDKITCIPPFFSTSSVNLISVPLPAKFVARITNPGPYLSLNLKSSSFLSYLSILSSG